MFGTRIVEGGAADRVADAAQPIERELRLRLLTEQIHALVNMTPVLSLGSVAVATILLAVSAGTNAATFVVAWSFLLAGTLILAMRTWIRSRRHGLRAATPNARTHAIRHAYASGLVWGMVPLMLLPVDSLAAQLGCVIAVAGVLTTSTFAFAVFPAVAIAFAMPVFVGSLLGVMAMPGFTEMATLTYLLLAFALVMPLLVIHIARSFVARLKTDLRVRHQSEIISLLLNEFEASSSDWLWEFRADGTMQRVSDRFAAAAGHAAEHLVGSNFCRLLAALQTDDGRTVAEIEAAIAERATFRDIELAVSGPEGERWWRLTGKPIFDEQGGYCGYIGTASDVTAAKEADRRINYLAHHDPLTGLLNRGRFTELLRQAVAGLERHGTPFTVLFLDLDQFKLINDTRGHLVGDELLKEVAARLSAELSDIDVPARFGGDEFAVIHSGCCDAATVAELAGRLVESIGRPYDIEGGLMTIGVSAGIALAPENGTRPDQLLRNADLALYRAKADGKGVYRFFQSEMDRELRERRILELELHEAIGNGELLLHYQPLVATGEDRAAGFEALLRWNHPIRGLISPVEFIPIAEQSGLINRIGDWTIREACLAAATWPDHLFVAVNLSPRHFQMSDIVGVVRRALDESGLSPGRLELEITESLLIERPEEVAAKLAELKTLGVTVAMDDFGTGYSSLSYLLRFPFDKIKIDKSFVSASSRDPVARDILRSIASLGKSLKIRITAEGVETQEQVEFLSEIACHHLQGFYFARPLDGPAMAAYLLAQYTRPASQPLRLALAG